MDFNNASLAELRQYVKANGIKGTSAMKKKELAEYLIEREQNNGDIKSATSEKTNNNQKKKVGKIRKEKNTIEKNMEISEASEEKNIAGGYVDESFRTGSEQNVTYNDMTSVTDKGEASDGTLHIDVESGDGRYRQDNGRRLRNTVRNYRGRVDNRGDNRYDNHVEARRDVYRADHKSDPRTDYRQDRRTDSRNDNRYDNRNDNRYDNRNDNR